MRDIMLFMFVMVMLSLAFKNVFSSYLVWTWTAVVFPTAWVYGFMTSSRLNLVFALLTLTLMLVKKQGLNPFRVHRTTGLILLFFGHASLCALFAFPNNPHNATYYEIFFKSLVLALLLPNFITSRLRFHAFLATLVLGMGFLAGVEGLKSIKTLGSHPIRGMHVGMLSDNNHFAAGIVTFLPISMYMAQRSAHRWARILLWCVFAVAVFCVLGSRSRGGFVGLLAVGLCLVVVSRNKLRSLAIVGVLASLFVAYAPEDITGRLDTIKSAKEEDMSFKARMIAWRVSSAVAMDHPVFGGGLHSIQVQSVWERYLREPGLFPNWELPDSEPFARAAHSIYFEVMGDQGFVGLGLFLLLMANAYYTLFQISRMTKKRADLKWANELAFTFVMCLVGYMVTGAAVSLAYLEFYYIVLMSIEVLRQLVLKHLAKDAERARLAAQAETDAWVAKRRQALRGAR
jgi:probable O-glycosylation ligase (exosortase A-associated)